jgi:hypothetical protein
MSVSTFFERKNPFPVLRALRDEYEEALDEQLHAEGPLVLPHWIHVFTAATVIGASSDSSASAADE